MNHAYHTANGPSRTAGVEVHHRDHDSPVVKHLAGLRRGGRSLLGDRRDQDAIVDRLPPPVVSAEDRECVV